MAFEFTVLGEVSAANADRTVNLGSPQQRALLSLLLLARGRPVLLDSLIDQMWGGAAPTSARLVVRTYINRLRRAFTDAGGPTSVILTLSSGYQLPRTFGYLDLWSFEECLSRAQTARDNGKIIEASALFRSALSLWRGPALTGARGEFVESERNRLEESRLQALEARIQVDLELGLHKNLVAELTGLVASYPLREQFHELLMLSLYQCGRQADALAAYHQVRKLLDKELAVSPGPGLQRMQERILRGDPDLRPSITEAPIHRGATMIPTPAQLPADIPDFVGRNELMCQLAESLERPDGPNLCALHGLDGMGKTTLAVHVAHTLRDRYPDGQLFADLRGASAQRTDPAEILGRFLRSLGYPGELPRDLEERAALWRSCVNGRRLLIVLDDAADGNHVRHLLPGSPGAGVIITSVRRLGDLPALRSLGVDPLTSDESTSLLVNIVGKARLGVEPQAVARLLNFAAGYPLVLRTVGRRVAERRSWRVADVARQLCDEVHDPSAIHDADYRSIPEALRRSESLVASEAAAAMQLMRVVQVAAFDVASVAAMLDVSHARALSILDSLTEVHLLERLPDCQFAMLNPVRCFAGNDARTNIPDDFGWSAVA
jgi:DNA-binding SARP family transcriptional activator